MDSRRKIGVQEFRSSGVQDGRVEKIQGTKPHLPRNLILKRGVRVAAPTELL
jgi:hypothetical protein